MGLIQSPQASPQELARLFTFQEDPLRLAYTVASLMNLEAVREQALLEATTRVEALRLVHGWLSHEVEVLELRNKITEEARGEMSREQKEYILRQQKKAIEQELGEKNPRSGRGRATARETGQGRSARGCPQGSRARARAAGEAAAFAAGAQCDPDVARIRDRAAVEQAQRRQPGSGEGAASAGRRSLRARQSEGAHPGAPGGAEAESGSQGSDPVLRGCAGRGQNVAGAIHRARAGAQVRAHEPGRLA